MDSWLQQFEKITRMANGFSMSNNKLKNNELHPFDVRNIHPKISEISQSLFDNGHYSQATFETYKYIDTYVSELSGVNQSGYKLMMEAFNDNNPKIKLTDLSNTTEIDEQKGYRYIFAGTIVAIRNPRGHAVGLSDSIDECLDHLSCASLLLRRLDERVCPL